MKTEQILHMAGGSGEHSYANNSTIQGKGILRIKPIVEEAISEICNKVHTDKFIVADLGCSSGPNTLLVVSQITDAIEKYYYRFKENQLEIQYFLNDLPSNDFNNIFKLLMIYEKQLKDEKGAEYVPIYISGLPGSFYGRLFPSESVHFFYSSYSLMWLSQVPQGLDDQNSGLLNKGNIHIVDASSLVVYNLYLNQFKRDFSEFLKSRSKELIFGGKMVLSIFGRKKNEGSEVQFHFIGLLADVLNTMVFEGLIEEAKLDAFNLPIYLPLMEEVESVVEMEGSFCIDQAQTFESNFDTSKDSMDTFVIDNTLKGQNVAKCIRAVLEPLLIYHFGVDVMEELFSRYAKNIVKHISLEKVKIVTLILVLKLKE